MDPFDIKSGSDPITEVVIGCAIEVHRELGPGLLESAYEECLAYELKVQGLDIKRQIELPIKYKSVELKCGYRMDILIPDKLVIELKTVEKLLPIHQSQILTYLRLSGVKTGLLINFYTTLLKNGIKRIVL
ncbi:MAG: GxxExxY protein [Proteobacteria bacterium]|nr:GxxExxY protein [Pseudomonadota bacterium]